MNTKKLKATMVTLLSLIFFSTSAQADHIEPLSNDNAYAFVDALEFVYGELGKAEEFRSANKNELAQAMGEAYQGATFLEQIYLVSMKSIWIDVRNNWSRMSYEAKNNFAYQILMLAHGEEEASYALGGYYPGQSSENAQGNQQYEEGSSNSGNSSSSDHSGDSTYFSSGGATGDASFSTSGECSYFSSGGMSMSTCD